MKIQCEPISFATAIQGCHQIRESGNSGKIKELYFNQGKSRGKERYIGKSGKIMEVLELLLFRFRVVTFYILSHTPC